jgi:hypothetical protein
MAAGGRCPEALRRRADRIATLNADDEQGLITLLEDVG